MTMIYLEKLDTLIFYLLENAGLFYPVLLLLLIVIESIIPVLPLALFITLSFKYFGIPLGFILSYLLTILGCYISYIIFKSDLKYRFKYYNKYKPKLEYFRDLPLERLTLLVAIPFTPAFLINVLAGLSNMDQKKFLTSIFVGKIFLVFFWGFLGYSFLDSLTNIKNLVIIFIILLLAYLISKIISKNYDL